MKRARRTPPSHTRKIVARPRYRLTELLQMPDGPLIDAAWETIRPVGREVEPAAATLRNVRAMQRFMRKQLRKRAGGAVELRRLVDEGRD